MQRSQILHRQLNCVACTVAPLITGDAALKVPTAIVDHYERLFAFKADAGHGSALLGLPIGRDERIRLDGTTVLGDALIKTAKCNTTDQGVFGWWRQRPRR